MLYVYLLVFAAIAAALHTLIIGLPWQWRAFVARLVAYAVLLILPALVPRG